MESRYTFWLSAVSAPLAIVLMTMVLAGCRGVVAGSGPPPPPGNVTMSVTVTGTGTGTVTSTPAGINCPTTCSASFPQNSQVTLSETPGTSNTFSGWSGACTGNAACNVTLSAADSVTATFAAAVITSVTMSVTLAGTGTGTVTSTPAGINCPTTCSASFPQNSQVTLSETPATGYAFSAWSGGCTGT